MIQQWQDILPTGSVSLELLRPISDLVISHAPAQRRPAGGKAGARAGATSRAFPGRGACAGLGGPRSRSMAARAVGCGTPSRRQTRPARSGPSARVTRLSQS